MKEDGEELDSFSALIRWPERPVISPEAFKVNRITQEMIDEFGSLAVYFWAYSEEGPPPSELQATTEASMALSKDLKKRGWSFVGPTTLYAFMQAMGLVNDHLVGCPDDRLQLLSIKQKPSRIVHDTVFCKGSHTAHR